MTIREALEAGYAEFTYIKEDGNLRLARGTRNPRVLKEIKTFTFAGRKTDYRKHVPYWDFDRDDWRSYHTGNEKQLLESATADEIITED